MKYIATLVSGLHSGFLGHNIQTDMPYVKRLVETGHSGKIRVATSISTQDEFVSFLPLLGYDPKLYYKGEGSLLAARAGVHLEKDDVAFCCDLITLKHPQDGYFFPKLNARLVMEDLPFDSVNDEEGKELIREMNEQVGTESIVFYPVKNICHLMVWVGGKSNIQTVSPHQIVGKPIFQYLPKGEGAAVLVRCMEVASQFLQQHIMNEERISQGKSPVNGLWISRPGKLMNIPTWEDLYDLRGTLIADDEFIQGIGQLAGFATIEYKENGEGTFENQCHLKAKAVLKSLATHDFVFVHLTSGEDQQGALQAIDKIFLGTIMSHLENTQWKFLFMESSPFSEFPRQKIHLPIDKEISFLISSPGFSKKRDLILNEGHLLIPGFIKGGT